VERRKSKAGRQRKSDARPKKIDRGSHSSTPRVEITEPQNGKLVPKRAVAKDPGYYDESRWEITHWHPMYYVFYGERYLGAGMSLDAAMSAAKNFVNA
jgi:hypothetical protein